MGSSQPLAPSRLIYLALFFLLPGLTYPQGTWNFWNNCPFTVYYSRISQGNSGPVRWPTGEIDGGTKQYKLPFFEPVGAENFTMRVSISPGVDVNSASNGTEFIDFRTGAIVHQPSDTIFYSFQQNYTSPNWTDKVGVDSGQHFGTVVSSLNCYMGYGCIPLSRLVDHTMRNFTNCSSFCDIWVYTCVYDSSLPGAASCAFNCSMEPDSPS